MNLFELIKRSIFPKRCELCGEVIEIDKNRCGYCEFAQRMNGRSTDAKMAYESVTAPYLYMDSIRAGIHKFKYRGFTELAKGFAKEMADTVKTEYRNIDFDLITYVPLAKKKKRKRGYNQAELLAKELSKELDVPCVNALNKIKNTDSQQGKKRKERMNNLKDAFEIADVDVKGKTILLVDDVKTTGSTLNECSKVLKRNKADKVYAVTIAVTRN